MWGRERAAPSLPPSPPSSAASGSGLSSLGPGLNGASTSGKPGSFCRSHRLSGPGKCERDNGNRYTQTLLALSVAQMEPRSCDALKGSQMFFLRVSSGPTPTGVTGSRATAPCNYRTKSQKRRFSKSDDPVTDEKIGKHMRWNGVGVGVRGGDLTQQHLWLLLPEKGPGWICDTGPGVGSGEAERKVLAVLAEAPHLPVAQG